MPDQTDLFRDFPAISKAEWLEKINKDLKGKPLEALQWPLGDHLVDPFLMEADFDTLPLPITGNTPANTWEISEDIIGSDTAAANAQVLEALAGGLNAPRWLIGSPDTSTSLTGLLQGINPEMISMHFQLQEAAGDAFEFRDALVKWLRNQCPISGLKGSVQTPPMGKSERQAWISEGLQMLPAYTWITIDGTPYFTRDVQQKSLELANMLADAQRIFEYQAALGMDIALLANTTQVNIEIGDDYFVEIAKIRALKLLWGNLLSAYGVPPALPEIWAITSPAVLTEDAHRNMIVTTTQAMSAAIGGVSRITVTPSDNFLENTSAFSRRIARNVQHLLTMESYMDKVSDPVAGSYYIEQLTEVLAGKAWEIFCAMNA